MVTVPSMSPGKAGYPHTYHKVRVEVGGVESNPADFFITPVTTITGQNYTSTNTVDGNMLPGTQNVLYENCTWTDNAGNLQGVTGGVLQLNNNNCYVTLLNCTINSNTGPGAGDPGFTGVNGVKVLDWGGTTHDVTFADCTWGNFSRMGIELVGNQSGSTVLYNYAIRGCTFGNCGWEPISFSTWASGNVGRNVYSLIEDCMIHNGYNNGGAIESNGSPMLEIRDCDIWRGGAPVFNLERLTQNNSSAPGSRNIYVKGVTVDFSKGSGSVTGFSQMSSISGMNNSVWDDCRFNCGTSPHTAYGLVLESSSNNVWRNSTIWGTTSNYFLQMDGSSGNTPPTVK